MAERYGLCVQSTGYNGGTGQYGDNEKCTIINSPAVPISVTSFDVFGYAIPTAKPPFVSSDYTCYDYLKVNGKKYCKLGSPEDIVPDGTPIEWSTDNTDTDTGWELCFYPKPPPPAPPLSPPLPPSLPAPPLSPQPSLQASLPAVVIAGAIAGGVVGLAGLALVAYLLCRKMRATPPAAPKAKPSSDQSPVAVELPAGVASLHSSL